MFCVISSPYVIRALTAIDAKIPTAGIHNTNKNVENYDTP